jgi:hypothetical protein
MVVSVTELAPEKLGAGAEDPLRVEHEICFSILIPLQRRDRTLWLTNEQGVTIIQPRQNGGENCAVSVKNSP